MLSEIEKAVYKIAKENKEAETEYYEIDDEIDEDFSNIYYVKVIKVIESFGGKNIKFISCDCKENLEEQMVEYANNSTTPYYIISDPYYDDGGSIRGGIIFEHPKIPKHPKNIGGLDDFVENLSNLSYDALADFLDKLSKKIAKDSKADEGRGRLKLANQLARASNHIGSAWKICKKFMK